MITITRFGHSSSVEHLQFVVPAQAEQQASASRHNQLWNNGSPGRAGNDSYCVRGNVAARSPIYAAFVFASRIARHTRSGVSGMSIWVMPWSESASSTALTMQTRLPAQPASPQPLVPSGLDLAGEG